MSNIIFSKVWNDLASHGLIPEDIARNHIEMIENATFQRSHLPTETIHVRLRNLITQTPNSLQFDENMFMTLKILQQAGRQIHVFSRREKGSNLGKLRGLLNDQGWQTSSIDSKFLGNLQDRALSQKHAEAVFFSDNDLKRAQIDTITRAHISVINL